MENKTYMIPPVGGKSMLQTVEDVEAYDYTAGYPERLVFEL